MGFEKRGVQERFPSKRFLFVVTILRANNNY